MAEESPRACAEPVEPKATAPPERTSDYYRKVFYPNSNKFSQQLAAGGMFRNNTLNVYLEKSVVTGPDNYITCCDRLNFHPSYNINRPSICD
ncbi:piercer of microtubule wall 1 protein isoform X3 [Macaca fascicularis]|uniref:piercer of microtubule wall 1 protein isoform X3 n=1 Tax=Macaca fascicularis TaxID=9541 RepID=UPI003D155942